VMLTASAMSFKRLSTEAGSLTGRTFPNRRMRVLRATADV
jgi:hypothetical protein